jgi:hypothetical protein
MKERKKLLPATPLQVRVWTLTDKDSMFRAKEPDRHIVEIAAVGRGKHVIIREFVFEGKGSGEQARGHYKHLVSLLA